MALGVSYQSTQHGVVIFSIGIGAMRWTGSAIVRDPEINNSIPVALVIPLAPYPGVLIIVVGT